MNFARPYRPYAVANDRRASAIRIAELAVTADGLIDTHRINLLNVAIWKMTEADGKYNVPYRSKAVLALPTPATRGQVVHEHVFPRSTLVRKMLTERHRIAEALEGAVACLVTKEEHALLARIPDGTNGWERYRVAGIELIDMRDGRSGYPEQR